MRISFRLIFSLIIGVSLVAFVFAYYQVRAEKRGLRSELEKRAAILAESLGETITPLLENRSRKDLQRLVERFGNRERLAGVVVYDPEGNALAITPGLATGLTSQRPAVRQAGANNKAQAEFFRQDSALMHVHALPLRREGAVVGVLALFHDAAYIEAQSGRLWRENLQRVLVQTLFIALATLLIVRWSIVGPIARTAQWMKELRTGRGREGSPLPTEDLFKPLA